MSDKTIYITEHFGPTMQGEGIMTGTITNFLRTGGCPLRCTWCDSMHSVDPVLIKEFGTKMTGEQIGQLVTEMPWAPYLTLTGGDPCMHEMLGEYVIPAAHNALTRVAVETQGTLFPSWLPDVDIITFSPKGPSSGNIVETGPLMHWLERNAKPPRNFQICFKIVVQNKRDLEYALEWYRMLPEMFVDEFWIQLCTPDPEFQKRLDPTQKVLKLQANFHDLVEELMYVQQNVEQFNHRVRIGFQQHVFVWPKSTMGV